LDYWKSAYPLTITPTLQYSNDPKSNEILNSGMDP